MNILPAIAWLMLRYANTKELTYTAFGVLGFGIGLSIAGRIYISEIS